MDIKDFDLPEKICSFETDEEETSRMQPANLGGNWLAEVYVMMAVNQLVCLFVCMCVKSLFSITRISTFLTLSLIHI